MAIDSDVRLMGASPKLTLAESCAVDNIVRMKSKAFAIRCVKLCQYLSEDKREFVLSRQVLKSGTSIGANVREALQAESRADFVHKMTIALKEAAETEYWFELLQETGYIGDDGASQSLMADCKELNKLLTSIIKSAKKSD